ncbi:MAG TPA: AraC family transcriptional regulator, partial [Gemmatimonadaceae bacterium]
MTESAEREGPLAQIVALVRRDRSRSVLRAAFPRRKARLVFARGAEDLATLLRTTLVDSAVIDLTSPTEDTWRAVSFAADHPSAAFFAIAPLRAGDAPPIAECATRDFAGALVEGVDDLAIRDMVLRAAFSSRFERALAVQPPALRLDSPLQRRAWEQVVAHAGRPVRTAVLASVLEVTREHLSRSFAAKGSPNLKRVIDLVRLIAAAELAKNPGLDLRDVASVLEFASPSHLSTTAQ